MPRPPVLPLIDWPAVLAACLTYTDWLAAAESAKQAGAIDADRATVALEPQEEALLHGLARPVRVLAFAEDWCGDVVRHVPVLQAMAERCDRLLVRYAMREQLPDVFVRFLTNGGEAIPKFVFLGENHVECGSWGPMPSDYVRLIARGKACGDVAAARRLVALRYAADPGKREVVRELLALVETAAAVAP